ncbi:MULTISPECIES: PLP-dependent aminotransferase family protein [Brevibacillus]|uniref:aminotransferase-like domain-containing protein n=1 Tax=Brevibacillus TaxID=55080 RepID=UPI000D0F6D29|nr:MULTISPECIES: PLP-dependent aminotransferase family protein [Brevibacillus]MED1945974.1 PLP-dependent aminotransferase family protein [Brevibacillus formosus]MED1997835.1 PLP-dependent aminotransferase family protein [Brevibacillus formosus]MED2083839.1 PLP-dependent aminotransferase family protein [Brevibacillus formosus]PSK17890.1 PLP-dependent aminotransferase family protein [Brevibacillus sp. NRRL NRS-603]
MPERPYFSFHFHKQSHTPIYVQLAEQLKTAILRGAFLVDGQQLISLRDMKTISGCSLETVKKAYDHLALEGWLEAVHGKGYYLTQLAKEARLENRLPLTDIPIASLADSSPRPSEELVKRLRGAFYESLTVLDEPSAKKKIMRTQAAKVFADHLSRRGLPHSPERLLLFNRSTSGFAFLAQRVMNARDVVYVEEYSYPVFLRLLSQCGITVRPIRMDEEGVCIQALNEEQEHYPANWLLINPHYQFPTGISYSLKRKEELLEWAQNHNVRLIENDHYGDLWFEEPSVPLYQMAAQAKSTIEVYYLHSLSKTLARDLQLGVLMLPSDLSNDELERYSQLVSMTGAEPSLLVVEAAVQLLDDPWFYEEFLADRRALFQARFLRLWQERRLALPDHARMFPITGGLNTWIKWGTPTARATEQEERVVAILREEGLELTGGHAFRVADEPADTLRCPAVRFPLAPLEERELKHWLHRLGAALLR